MYITLRPNTSVLGQSSKSVKGDEPVSRSSVPMQSSESVKGEEPVSRLRPNTSVPGQSSKSVKGEEPVSRSSVPGQTSERVKGEEPVSREMRQLQVENKYLKLILDDLYKSIFVGEATLQMELKIPEEIKNDELLIELTNNTRNIRSRFSNLETELSASKQEMQEMANKIKEYKQNYEKLWAEHQNLKTSYKALQKSSNEANAFRPQSSAPGVMEHHTKTRAWENKNLEWEKEEADWEKLIAEKADLQRRLSTIDEYIRAHGNVSITDLSDADRPTKLGEVYTELYDNVWTEAFEELTKHDTITENDAFMILLKILMCSFQNCRAMTWCRYEKLINVASSLDIKQESSLLSAKHLKFTIDLNFDLIQAIKGIWRKTTVELKGIAAEPLYSVIETCLDMPFNVQPMTSNYLKRCIDLCWKMGAQDKPLHLDGFAEMEAYAGTKFNEDKFDAHARSGSHVAFVVWPTLYLYEGGPILAKGIAQCCSPDEMENEESS